MIFLEMLWSIIIHALFKIPYFISFRTNFIYYYHSFKTWSGPRGSTRDWNGAWLKKKHGKKKPGVTQLTRRVDSTTRSKTRLQPIDFCFFFLLKQYCFDLKKKLIWTTRWSGQNSEPRPWTGLGLKNYSSYNVMEHEALPAKCLNVYPLKIHNGSQFIMG